MKKLILFLIILLFITACAKKQNKETSGFKVATYNLRATRINDSLAQAKLLDDYNVQIAGVQEVNYNNKRFSDEDFNSLSGFNNYYPHHRFANAIDFAGGYYGIAVVSKQELSNDSFKVFDGEKPLKQDVLRKLYYEYRASDEDAKKRLKDFKTDTPLIDRLEPRVYQRVEFEWEGNKIAFYNAHLSYESKDLRTKQMQELIKAVKNDKLEYKIITGDFNNNYGDEFEIFKEDFYMANGKDDKFLDTFISTKGNRPIDNIFVSKNIEIIDSFTVNSPWSDHLPLIAEIKLK